MKMKFRTSTLHMALMLSLAAAGEVFVSDPGDGMAILLEEQVPNVLGSPWESDRPITINSPVHVNVLRYSDYPEFFLEGGQALYSHEIFLVVKSDCGDDASLIPQVEYGSFTRNVEWDNGEYTGSINISFPDADEDAIDTEKALEPSVFAAFWNYTSFWCQEFAQGTEAPTVAPRPTDVPLDDTMESPEISGATTASPGTKKPETRPPRTSQPSAGESLAGEAPPTFPPSVIPNRIASIQNTGSAAFSAKTIVSLVATLLSGMFMVMNLGGQQRGFRGSLMMIVLVMTLMILGTTLFTTSGGMTLAKSPTKSGNTQRKLQECAVSVEILLDGCRRVDQTNDTDLLVTAPSVSIYDGEVVDLNTTASVEDECVTDFQADLVFTLSETDNVVATERQQSPVVAVPSFSAGETDSGTLSPTDAFGNGQYGACFRAIEGRPYVDSNGRHVHAPAVRETRAAWSTTTESHVFEKDAVLGKQWLDRALGEHASVPAFAAFTIALMSNNAPPELVKDALSASQDEVRHAETSFEIASLLLGETVEPGPLPPSSLSFGQDMTALALAAAKEGCVDETLSALVAGLEVDYQIDQNTRLSHSTKAVLKDKMRTIALEETRHSGLAWRTVQWACAVDEDACTSVQNQVFDPKYLEHAFSKRFGHFEGSMLRLAKQVWDNVHTTLTPIVLRSATEMQELRTSGVLEGISILPCEGAETFLEQEKMSILEDMGVRIIAEVACLL